MEKNYFTLRHSNVVKGVAILMMMFHHCFMSADRYEGYVINFFPFTEQGVNLLSSSFKICVSLFAFVSGYGLFETLKNYRKENKALNKWYTIRYIKMMSGYWFVLIVMTVICEIDRGMVSRIFFQQGMFLGMFYQFLQFAGVSSIFGAPMLVGTWWYMGCAVLFIILVPIIYKVLDTEGGIINVLFLVFVLPRLAGVKYPGGVYPTTFICAMVLGCIANKHDLFLWLDKNRADDKKILKNVVVWLRDTLLLYIAFRLLFVISKEQFWDIIWGIIPVYVIYYIFKYLTYIPIFSKALEILGKHSMNIFLIHTFIRATFFQDFIYSWKHFALVVAVLLIVSILVSCVIEVFKDFIGYKRKINQIIEYIECK